jgi:SAM-dependent methyltransferase
LANWDQASAAAGDGETTREAVRQQFGAVAANYVTSAVHARGADLVELVRAAAPTGEERVLDLGTAAGHAALALAPHVLGVTGVDITPEMLEHARALAAERGIANAVFRQADVEQLPFVDRSFDLVISRFSAHHWPHPGRALHQVARVLRPGGRCLLIDTVGPDDPEADRFIDEVERLRDPSHHRDWTLAEWLTTFAGAGLTASVRQTWDLELDFDEWVARMRTPPESVARLRGLLAGASPKLRETFHIRERAGRRAFTLPCAMFQAERLEA